jgi:antibiotic biosynthesis monooxygenase (ABM) superfamily enzyme
MKPPVKYKMALLIWCAIYPTINILFFLLNGILAPYSMPIKTLVMTLILVPLMVYFFLPFITKTFVKWLTK